MGSAGFYFVAPLRLKIPDDWGSVTKFIYLYRFYPDMDIFIYLIITLYVLNRKMRQERERETERKEKRKSLKKRNNRGPPGQWA